MRYARGFRVLETISLKDISYLFASNVVHESPVKDTALVTDYHCDQATDEMLKQEIDRPMLMYNHRLTTNNHFPMST